MSIDELRYFMTVCRCGSFSKAASELNISQQGLSRAIKSLEKECGESLFARSSRGAVPTEFGKKYMSYARKVVAASDSMKHFIHDYKMDKSRCLRIGLRDNGTQSPINSGIINTVEDFKGLCGPGITIETFFGDQYNQMKLLKSGKLDVVQIVCDSHEEGLEEHVVIRCKMAAIAAESLGIEEGRVLSIRDLKDIPLLLPPENNPYYLHIADLCRKEGFEPKIAGYEPSAKMMAHIVYRGGGLALLPEMTTESICRMYPNVREYAVEPAEYYDYKLVVLKATEKSELAQQFLSYVEENAEKNIIPDII